MGKTVTAQRLARTLSERRAEDPTLPIPLYFDLKKIASPREATDLQTVVTTCMRDGWLPKYSPDYTWERFVGWLSTTTCLVIFDGLDELLVKFNQRLGDATTQRLLGVLDVVPPDRRVQTKVLLTCRTHYFPTLRAQRTHFLLRDRSDLKADSYRAMVLLPFAEEQIRSYLAQAIPSTPVDTVLDMVHSIHNLSELSKRPYTLMLISEQIPQLEELRAQGQPVVSTTLYQAATESWLEHDNSKHYLAREHKPRLVAALAAHLWRTGTTLLPISDLNDWFHLWRSSDPALQARYASADADRLEEDLRTATFLAREDGARAGFRFAHTSLQEYFLAPHLAQAVERDDPEAWAGPVPSGETLTFLGELFASDYSEAFPTLSSWCQTYRPMVSELIFTYARHAHERDLPTPSLRGIDLHGIDLDDLTVLGRADKPVDLTGADFTGCSLRRAVFSHVILRGARFTDACLTQATFDRCTCTDTVWPEELPETTWSGSIASLTALDQESGIYWFSDGNGLPTWSPEGCQVAAISGSTVRVWDPTTGQVLTTLTGHTDTVTAIAWSPDSTRIATTSRDRTARVWDPTTGQTLTTLTGHTDTPPSPGTPTAPASPPALPTAPGGSGPQRLVRPSGWVWPLRPRPGTRPAMPAGVPEFPRSTFSRAARGGGSGFRAPTAA